MWERESVCVCVALVIQSACAYYIAICGLPGSAVYFHILIHATILGGGELLNMKCVCWFSLQIVYKTFPILRRIQRDTVTNVKSLHVKCPTFLSDFNETWILSTGFFEKAHLSNFIKFHPVGAELFHAEGQTDMTKLIVAFCSVANAPKNKTRSPCNVKCSSVITLTYRNLSA